jgi:hypothetical protein
MLYQLPNGKVIEISLEDYLEMTDIDFQNIMAFNLGEHINNPWVNSAIDEDQEPEEEDIVKELPEVPDQEKLEDQDYYEEE